jgi:hypothetical protein
MHEGRQVFDDLLLLAVSPSRQNERQELPRLQALISNGVIISPADTMPTTHYHRARSL